MVLFQAIRRIRFVSEAEINLSQPYEWTHTRASNPTYDDMMMRVPFDNKRFDSWFVMVSFFLQSEHDVRHIYI